jgi:hypothetical protein
VGSSSSPNRERTQEYQRLARHLLMELDPIGVSDTPEAVGEYDYMIGPLLHRLSRSVTPPHHPFHRRRDCAGRRRPGVRRSRARRFRPLPRPEPGRTGDTAPVVVRT